jgi:hypothetical protein
MKAPTRTLAIVALSTIVSCSSPAPSATSTSAAAEVLRLYTTNAALPLVTDMTTAYGDSSLNLVFETRAANFRSTLERLLEGETPYFVSNHFPASSPLSLWAAPIATDGIAVITHLENPVTGLSLDQLRGVFQGQYANWNLLGGPDLRLNVISREDGSGTAAEFHELVMGPREITRAAQITTSGENMVATVAATPGSIGFVSLAYVDGRVKTLALDGVLPSQAAVQDETYPLRTPIYVIGLEEPEGIYRAFIGWMQSPQGQAVASLRYTPLLTVPDAE